MMTAAVVLVLVTSNSIVECYLAGQATFRQELEGAIHGGVANFRVLFLYQPVQFIARKMFPRFKERSENCVPLLSMFEAYAPKMLVENPLRLAHHLARDAGLVIYSFLQRARHLTPL